ncbi:hypothetical protein [Virgibacillus alimentarius]|uniref:hypothetical protein n=1 Tax=Virgibacillus alimentarius TaxID=698769 RepID=UPI0004936059|nr:hypothetical protein [Virgibacillus alimentarius]
MLLKTHQLDDLATYASKAKIAGSKGMVVYSVQDTKTGGFVSGGRTSGFNPQKTFNVLLQTDFGSVYFRESIQDKNEIEQTIKGIQELESSFTLFEVTEVKIDRDKQIGNFKVVP